ncbi:MAG: GTPase domain-containing protein [Holophaga sp.]|nr:GTPase domain-containing protein [Holophaga sp.]
MNTETDRTLFFDLLPMEVGVIGGFKAKLQLYTVPGQVFYNSTRKLVLKGVDGIVFVADSQTAMLDANRESIQNLSENLRELGLKLADIPMVFQWNKRDLKQIVAVELLERELNPGHLVSFPAVARNGDGVFETLRGISRLALAQIKLLHLGDGPAPRVAEAPAPPPAAPPVHPPPVAPPAPPTPAWSLPTPPTSHTPPSSPTPPAPPEPVTRPGTTTAGIDTHPGRAAALPEALSFLDLTPPESAPPAEPLPEALSFLDLSSALDLFETLRDDEPEPPQDPRGSGELNKADGQVKVMAPLVVKLLPPQPAKATQPGAVPRVSFKALAPPSPLLRGHSWASAAARPATPALQVSLPPDADGGELEVHVQVRRKGLLLAEAATVIVGPGPDGAGTLAIEFKRS